MKTETMNALKEQIRADWHYADADPMDAVSIEPYAGDIDGMAAQPGDVFASDGVGGAVYRPIGDTWSKVWTNQST